MKVLVTGAAGFIGMHVSQRLLARGDTVVGIDNLNDYYDVNLKLARLEQLKHPSFSFQKIDIGGRRCDRASVRRPKDSKVSSTSPPRPACATR